MNLLAGQEEDGEKRAALDYLGNTRQHAEADAVACHRGNDPSVFRFPAGDCLSAVYSV